MLCKCSGKYIDIYFILKITFYDFSIEPSCDVSMRMCLCFNVLFLRFYRENGGGGGWT